MLRILLVPVFAICMLYGWPGWALLIFAVAAVTDALDGLIARWTGHQTTLGAWLDPMADKLLLVTMFVMLTLPGAGVNRIPLWLTVLVVSRDVAIVLTVAVINLAVARRTFRPSLFGKAATIVYLVTGVVALVANYVGDRWILVDVCVWTALALTLLSGIDYAFRVTRLLSASAAADAAAADPSRGRKVS
jgi:cardiolipin synthase